MTRKIDLGNGHYALVDDEDFDLVSQYRWRLERGYAKTRIYIGRGANWKPGKYQYRYASTYMHRIIMSPGEREEVDHINGNRADNRRSNLRICTHRENAQNVMGRTRKYSRYKGVTKVSGSPKWAARIMVDYKQIHLGMFDTEEQAAQAYNDAAIESFGEYAHLNILEES